MITPEMVAVAKTRARNATAMQNRRSVRHQPATRSVATTEVAHPLTMVTTQAATAVRSLGSPRCARPPRRLGPRAAGPPGYGGVWRGIWGVGVSVTTGNGPVGARRMIRVRESEADSGDSGGCALGAGSFGAVTSASVIADVKSPLSEPRHRINALGAAQQHLEMQVRAGGVAAIAHGGDLIDGHHALADADDS